MTTKRETLVLSNRGQITLPATLRKRFGLHSGDALTIEERDGELVLKPAVVLEVDIYTDADIAQWDKEDELTASQREAILKYLGTAA